MWQQAAGAAFGVFSQYQKNEQKIKQHGQQVYNYAANRFANNHRSSMIMDAGVKNIAAVNKEKTLHNMDILRAEQEAHANATVLAAAAGVEGNSVYDVKQNMSNNAASRLSKVEQDADAEIMNYTNSIYGAAYDLHQPYRPPELKFNKWSYLMAGVQGAMGGMGGGGLSI